MFYQILTDEELVEKFDLAGDDFKLDELSKEKEKDNKPKVGICDCFFFFLQYSKTLFCVCLSC